MSRTLDGCENRATAFVADPVADLTRLNGGPSCLDLDRSFGPAVRHGAEVFAWTNLEVKALASMLVEAGAVSEEEYDWLRNTVGRGAPDFSRPNPCPA